MTHQYTDNQKLHKLTLRNPIIDSGELPLSLKLQLQNFGIHRDSFFIVDIILHTQLAKFSRNPSINL